MNNDLIVTEAIFDVLHAASSLAEVTAVAPTFRSTLSPARWRIPHEFRVDRFLFWTDGYLTKRAQDEFCKDADYIETFVPTSAATTLILYDAMAMAYIRLGTKNNEKIGDWLRQRDLHSYPLRSPAIDQVKQWI